MFFGRAPLRVQPFFGFRSEDRISLTARALRSREALFNSRNFLSDFRTMLGQYTSHEVPGVEVEFEYQSACGEPLRHTATTDDEGFARFDFAFPSPHNRPAQTEWETATLRWQAVAGQHDGGEVTAHILAPGTRAGVGIISDVDDTIMETGITGNLRAIARNWKRVMVQMPSERILVPGARDFYAALGGNPAISRPDEPQARERPVFYVSSSPWNLFTYLVTFKRERDLPLGPIMLRDWGFNRKTLGSEGHGSHKLEVIERVLDHYPDMRFALVGDDTQKDAIAFAEIVAARPKQIAAVFIRTVSWANPNEAQLAARNAIEQAGVPFWTGSDYRAVDEFLAEIGLDSDKQVEHLVRASEDDIGAKD
ncbi:phosphatase domain-containing protein [uncultured Erythrobacter sp.]|uniref:phosphatase domain-containing protein n=1 Tax=uncultured Erythrobacter sp. TaxID=263913 RepID=UPI00260F2F46|nr:phosphatase domain-containing protein [uncultured Erythrobacter sp.]